MQQTKKRTQMYARKRIKRGQKNTHKALPDSDEIPNGEKLKTSTATVTNRVSFPLLFSLS